MRHSLNEFRRQYFQAVANNVSLRNSQIIIVTHLLPDRVELFGAISSIAPIALVISIPYSLNEGALQLLQKTYKINTPTLEQLKNEKYLLDTILDAIDTKKSVVILEIGGYCAPIINKLSKRLGGKLLGVIEDTEAGYRQYEKLKKFPCPVVSVARSALKEAEDFLVGSSCLFSTEHLLRKAGFLMQGKFSAIFGFGKVGRGVAHALLRKHCPVVVHDNNPIRCTLAVSEGFRIFDKRDSLRNAEIIFGATGNSSIVAQDFQYIKNGTLLVSCSSKDIEFDLKYLEKNYRKEELFAGFAKYQKGNQFFYLLGNGGPVNFLDGAVIGPVLALVQAEIILAIQYLSKLQHSKGIVELDEAARKMLAKKWLDYFLDRTTGYYRYA
jgi:adenosylhomocysteinase